MKNSVSRFTQLHSSAGTTFYKWKLKIKEKKSRVPSNWVQSQVFLTTVIWSHPAWAENRQLIFSITTHSFAMTDNQWLNLSSLVLSHGQNCLGWHSWISFPAVHVVPKMSLISSSRITVAFHDLRQMAIIWRIDRSTRAHLTFRTGFRIEPLGTNGNERSSSILAELRWI